MDTRKHTRHVLRPTSAIVEAYLKAPTDAGWRTFERAYLAILDARFVKDRSPFDALAVLVRTTDVYLGCSCPTATNPDVQRCHTTLALGFMRRHYPDLKVVTPS